MVRVLSEEPCCLGSLLAHKRAPRPSPAGEQVSKPPGVVRIDVPPLPDEVVRKPARIWIALRHGQVADPLILLPPVQQFPPEFFIHQAIAPEQASKGKRFAAHRLRPAWSGCCEVRAADEDRRTVGVRVSRGTPLPVVMLGDDVHVRLGPITYRLNVSMIRYRALVRRIPSSSSLQRNVSEPGAFEAGLGPGRVRPGPRYCASTTAARRTASGPCACHRWRRSASRSRCMCHSGDL